MKHLSKLLLAVLAGIPASAAFSGNVPAHACTPADAKLDAYLIYHELVSPAPLPARTCHYTCPRTEKSR